MNLTKAFTALIIFTTLHFTAFADTETPKEEIEFIDFLAQWMTHKTDTIDDGVIGLALENVYISLGSLNKEDFNFKSDETSSGYLKYTLDHPIIKKLTAKYPNIPIVIDSDGRLVIENNLDLSNVKFDFLNWQNFNIKGLLILSNITIIEDNNAEFENSKISHFEIWDIDTEYLFISNNQFDTLTCYGEGDLESLVIENNKIKQFNCEYEKLMTFNFHDNTITKNSKPSLNYSDKIINIEIDNTPFFSFWNNNIKGHIKSVVRIQVNSDDYFVFDNTLTSNLDLTSSQAKSRFRFDNNISGFIGLNSFTLSETNNDINWYDFKGKLAGVRHENVNDYSDSLIVNRVNTLADMKDTIMVYSVIRDYYQLYSIFKSNGNIKYANSAYAQMKDIETLRLNYEYSQSENLNDWFGWRLAQIMKIYTNHGTNPARALVLSFYIILFFSFIYIFFPSDWDTKSKSEILKNLKSALDKKESGTFMAISKFIFFFIVSMFNALTLSLNSFTTLGFGSIPTHGVAKYICILEGFIGWFLLLLFGVALINQVLF